MDYKLKLDNLSKLVDPEFLKTLSEKDQSMQEFFGITDEILTEYYKIAASFLGEKDWPDARDAFRFLTFLNPKVHEFWVGLGLAEQRMERFEEASLSYLLAEAVDPMDPIPLANAVQCYKAQGENDLAKVYKEKAIEACGDKQHYVELKKKLEKFNL